MNMPVLMMLNNQNPPEETAVECPGEQNIIDPQNVYVQLCGIDDPAKMALMCDDSIYGFIDGQWKKIVDIPCKQEHYLYPPNFSEHLADMFVLLAQEFIKAKAALTADGK
jgi:hypothetical protein